jgi:hypothetical protein
MARRRASMREGPLAELFRATEAAQRQAPREGTGEEQGAEEQRQEPPGEEPVAPHEETVEHVPTFERPQPPPVTPTPVSAPPPVATPPVSA